MTCNVAISPKIAGEPRQPWPTQIRPIRFWDIDRFQTVRWGDDTGVVSMF